jgi:hypothetical protein
LGLLLIRFVAASDYNFVDLILAKTLFYQQAPKTKPIAHLFTPPMPIFSLE